MLVEMRHMQAHTGLVVAVVRVKLDKREAVEQVEMEAMAFHHQLRVRL